MLRAASSFIQPRETDCFRRLLALDEVLGAMCQESSWKIEMYPDAGLRRQSVST